MLDTGASSILLGQGLSLEVLKQLHETQVGFSHSSTSAVAQLDLPTAVNGQSGRNAKLVAYRWKTNHVVLWNQDGLIDG